MTVLRRTAVGILLLAGMSLPARAETLVEIINETRT